MRTAVPQGLHHGRLGGSGLPERTDRQMSVSAPGQLSLKSQCSNQEQKQRREGRKREGRKGELGKKFIEKEKDRQPFLGRSSTRRSSREARCSPWGTCSQPQPVSLHTPGGCWQEPCGKQVHGSRVDCPSPVGAPQPGALPL